MLTALIALVFAVAALAAILFVFVVAGIRNEPHDELRSHAPGLIAAVSRRLLGVYVGRSDEVPTTETAAPASTTTKCG